MKAFEAVQARVAEADDLDSVMAVGWEAFEFILFVARRYEALKSDAFPTWMWAMGLASDGSNALEPGASRRGSGPAIDSGDLGETGEDDAFRALAALAGELRDRLRDAALDPGPERVHDARACARAAEAASELYELFAPDE